MDYILQKSAKGEEELTQMVSHLPMKHRSVLVMIDGKMTEDLVKRRLAVLGDIELILGELERQGFIERKAAPPPAPRPPLKPVDEAAPALNIAAKRYMSDYLYRLLGPDSEAIILRIERCRTSAELTGMIDVCSDTIARLGQEERAEKFRLKATDLLV